MFRFRLILNTTKIGTAPAAQPSSGWNGCTYGKFRSTKGQLGKQKRSPWLLILRLHICVVSDAPVFDTTSPGDRATDLDRSWLHRVMGVSPPRGSLPAALLACGWDWAEVSLSLTESLRYSLPSAVLWTDGPAWHLIWPSLIDVGQPGCQNRTEKYGCLRLQPCAVHLQVVLAHPPASLALVQRAPSGRYSDDRIFCFQGTTEKLFLLACIGEEVRILATPKFKFSQSFFEDPEYPHLPLVYRSA